MKVNKEEYTKTICEELATMMYDEPCCDYEHHVNITIMDVIENIKTFLEVEED